MATDKRFNKLLEIVIWAKEFGITRYEAVYELVFNFYETAGFWTDELEKELNSKSEEELYEIYLAI